MRRREFMSLLGGAATSPLVRPLAARAQEDRRIPSVGVLWHAGNEEEEGVFFTTLQQAFRDLGYVEGRTLRLEHTFAAEQYERFNANATTLVARKVDVLIAVTLPAAVAAKRATSAIPIVFAVVPDPVGLGLVASLARPDGNITGLTHIATEIGAKRIEILKEAVPGLSRLALLVNPNAGALAERNIAEAQGAAKTLNITVQSVEVRSPDDIALAFDAIDQAHLEGLVTGVDSMIHNERKRIAEFARARRLPTMVHSSVMVEAGGLMSYAPDYPALFRSTAIYVDKILKGARPADLPVEQPTKFELVINLKTAQAIGVNIPTSLLLRAEKVIE